jgi:hypothetical protein
MEGFDCLIPDIAVSKWEQFTVGVTTGGATRGTFRPATVTIENETILLSTETAAVAGGNSVTVAQMPLADCNQVLRIPLSTDSQFRAVIIRSLIVGGGFTLALIVMVLAKGGSAFSLTHTLKLCLLFGLGMSFLFSFLPNVMKIRKDLNEIHFVSSNGKIIPIVLRNDQIGALNATISRRGLTLTENKVSTAEG